MSGAEAFSVGSIKARSTPGIYGTVPTADVENPAIAVRDCRNQGAESVNGLPNKADFGISRSEPVP